MASPPLVFSPSVIVPPPLSRRTPLLLPMPLPALVTGTSMRAVPAPAVLRTVPLFESSAVAGPPMTLSAVMDSVEPLSTLRFDVSLMVR